MCIDNTPPAGRRGCSVHPSGAGPPPSRPSVYSNLGRSLSLVGSRLKRPPMRKWISVQIYMI